MFDAMEGCTSAHHGLGSSSRWDTTFGSFRRNTSNPYVKRNKTDAADAEAICEAPGRPSMRFVPIKTRDQQAVLVLHRPRSLLVGNEQR